MSQFSGNINIVNSNTNVFTNTLCNDMVVYTSNNTQRIVIGTSNVGTIVINSNSAWFTGSLGVGTATPGYTLDVSGNINASGTVLSANKTAYGTVSCSYGSGDSMIAHFPFDGSLSNAIPSSTISASSTGTVFYTQGANGKRAVYLTNADGSIATATSYVTVSGLPVQGAITVAMWGFLDSSQGNTWQPKMFGFDRTGSSAVNFNVNVNTNLTVLGFILDNGTGTSWVAPSGNGKQLPYHVAFTYDGVSNVTLYFNGSQVATTSAATGTRFCGAGNLYIGTDSVALSAAQGNQGWRGWVNDLRVYKKALSASEVSALYNGAFNSPTTVSVLGNLSCTGSISAANMGMFRNRLVNSDLRIAQINGGSAVTFTNANNGAYFIDRYSVEVGTYAGTLTASRTTLATTDAPFIAGLRYAAQVFVTTGGAVSNYLGPKTYVEGYALADLNLGTSYASPFTLSFWFKSSTAGTHCSAFRCSGRAYAATFTYAQAGTWQYVTQYIPPLTSSATAVNVGAGSSLEVYIAPFFTNNANAINTWVDNSANGYYGTNTTVNWATTTNNYIAFAGIQLEKGSLATPFEYRPIQIERAINTVLPYLQLYDANGQTDNLQTYPPNYGINTNVGGFGVSGTNNRTINVPAKGIYVVQQVVYSWNSGSGLGGAGNTTPYDVVLSMDVSGGYAISDSAASFQFSQCKNNFTSRVISGGNQLHCATFTGAMNSNDTIQINPAYCITGALSWNYLGGSLGGTNNPYGRLRVTCLQLL